MKIIFRCLVLLMVFCLRQKVSFAATKAWVGSVAASGTDWNTGSNWLPAGIPLAGDDITIGLTSTIITSPVFPSGSTIVLSSITFGVLLPPLISTISLTVNGNMTVTGDITQLPTVILSYTNTISGTGSLTCRSLLVGTSSPVAALTSLLGNNLTLISTIANFHILQQVIVSSTNITLTTIVLGLPVTVTVGSLNASFSLQGGTVLIDGNILTQNTSSGVGSPTFNIEPSSGNAMLKLSGLTPINSSGIAGSIDFYKSTGTGICTVEYGAASGNQIIYAAPDNLLNANPATYNYLTFSGGSAKKVNTGTLTVDKNWISGGGTVDLTSNNPIVTVGGNWTNSCSVNQGSGKITINGSVTNNAGGTLNLGTADLVIGGDYTNNTGGAYNQNTGTTTFNGTATQTLNDYTSTGTKFNNVTFTGASTKTMNFNSGGNFTVSPKSTLSATSSAILAVTSNTIASTTALTLLSTSAGDASIGDLSTGTITGSLNVQRYVQGPLRRYMLLSSPVTNSTTAFTNGTINTYNLVPLIATTYITGPGGSANNFDDAPATGNSPSVFVYDENAPVTANPNLVVGNEYKPFGSITEGLPAGNGFLYYFRGSRAVSNPFVRPFPATDNATLNFFGAVSKGTSAANAPLTVNVINFPGTTPPLYYIANTVGAPATLSYTATTPATKKGLNLIGNPYASVIDLRALYLANTGNRFYYMLIKDAPTGTASYSTKFAIYDAFTNSPGTGASRYALSGQGFFTLATAANSSITFNETMKVPYSAYLAAPSSIPVFNVKHNNPAPILAKAAVNSNTRGSISASTAYDNNSVDAMPRLRMELVQDSIIHNSTDINFDKNASSKFVPGEDAPYFQPSGQGDIFYSLTADSIGCFANYTCGLEKLKRINLIVIFSSYGLYKLTSPFKQNIDERYVINLKDKYTNDSLDVIHNSEYNFNIDKNAASYAHDRFYLTIGIAPGHNYKLLGFSGTKVTAGIQLTWKTDNESNFTKFAIEKSTNGGKSFIIIDSLLSTGAGSYTFTDPSPGNGQFTYRLVQTLVTGDTKFSENLVFDYADLSKITAFMVYPSNATQDIHIRLGQLYTSSIKINIVNSTGNIIKTISANNTDDVKQNVGNLMKGLYIVDAVDEATGKRIGSAKFFKQ